MEPAEYANLEAVEAAHWYYAGKRELVRRWLERVRPPRAADVLLDCGAGTGRFAVEMQAHCGVRVLDSHEESLRRLRQRFAPEQVLELVDGRIPLPAAAVAYVTALDVLEHVERDAAAVAEMARVLQPGGIAVVTVPAGRALWSDWDVALHHFRRYARRELCALFPAADWEIVHVNYTNVLLYPAVWLVRRTRRRQEASRAGNPAARWEDRVPPPWMNALLRRVFVGTGGLRIPFPFGVSLLLVARRRG
jgi:SAM-dependent methyltransferase